VSAYQKLYAIKNKKERKKKKERNCMQSAFRKKGILGLEEWFKW
jgi:hypothetical protein